MTFVNLSYECEKKIQNYSAFVVFIIKNREGLIKIIIKTN